MIFFFANSDQDLSILKIRKADPMIKGGNPPFLEIDPSLGDQSSGLPSGPAEPGLDQQLIGFHPRAKPFPGNRRGRQTAQVLPLAVKKPAGGLPGLFGLGFAMGDPVASKARTSLAPRRAAPPFRVRSAISSSVRKVKRGKNRPTS